MFVVRRKVAEFFSTRVAELKNNEVIGLVGNFIAWLRVTFAVIRVYGLHC